MGEGDRSLWRQVGRRRELGDTGEIGDSGDRGGVVDLTGDDASEDMLTVGHVANVREPKKTTVDCWRQRIMKNSHERK